MFVLITYKDEAFEWLTDVRRVNTSCHYRLWVSQYLLHKWCGLSDRYFENVRSKYKQVLPPTYKRIYIDRMSTNNYILADYNANWRWMLNDGFYYDYDHIPRRYRRLLPYKEELLVFAHVLSTRDNHLNKAMIINHIQSESTAEKYLYFEKYGFDDDLSDRLSVVAEWLSFIIWIVRNNLYAVYGFNEQIFYSQCLGMLKENHIEWLSLLSLKELENKVQTAPDDKEEFYTLILRICGKRRRKLPKDE